MEKEENTADISSILEEYGITFPALEKAMVEANENR